MGEPSTKFVILNFTFSVVVALIVVSIAVALLYIYVIDPVVEENSGIIATLVWITLTISWIAYMFNAQIREKDVDDYCIYLNKKDKKTSNIDPNCPDCKGSGKMKNGRFFLTTCGCIRRNAERKQQERFSRNSETKSF